MRLLYGFTLVIGLLTLYQPGSLAQRLTVTPGTAITPDLLFERFTSRNGLPDDRVRAFYQDSRGFLWIGTMNGLSRYDGYSFKKYYKNQQPNSISGNWTYAICEDAHQKIWVGTKEGLNCFDPDRETFTAYRHRPGDRNSLFCDQINTLVFDSRGQLWIGTPKGLACFDPATRQFRQLTGFPFTTSIGKLIRSEGDNIWIATAEGPVRYNVKTERYQHFPLKVRPNPYGDRFWTLLEDNHHLYMGTGGDGLMRLRYNLQQDTYGPFESLNLSATGSATLQQTEIFAIGKADSATFWLSTGRGLVRYDRPGTATSRIRLYRHNPVNEKSISDDRVYSLLIDRNQILWAGTENGLNKLNLQLLPFQYYTLASQQASDQIRSIFSDDGKTIWLGTAKSGLYRYRADDGTTQRYGFEPASSFLNFHRSLYQDKAHNLWLGTLGGATRLSAPALVEAQQKLDGATVFSFLEDSRRNLWIGTNNGLYVIGADGKKNQLLMPTANALTGDPAFVRALYEDHSGTIWVGFEHSGLYRFDPRTGAFTAVRTSRQGQQMVGSSVFSILEKPRNILWVGTESGLNQLRLSGNDTDKRPVQLQTYGEKDGLPDQSVNGILADAQGFLWLSTPQGLARFDYRNRQFRVHLPTLHFTHSCLSQADGKLLFGASDGFIMFDPTEVSTESNRPAVVLAELRVFNEAVVPGKPINGDTILRRSLASTPEVVLNHQQNAFSIGFTGLHFANPDQNRYAYQMDGFNPDWIQTSAGNRMATYTNLDPGVYIFRVKAANSLGQWSQQPTSVRVTIFPPPWKTWWAITLYVLALAAVLYGLLRYLLMQSRQRQQLRFEQLEKEQLRNLNQQKVRFFTDISHEFRTPLTLITGPVDDLLATPDIRGASRQKIQMVQHNARKLLHLIDELMTFQKLEQGMLKLRPECLDLVALVRTVYQNFESLADRKDLRFQLVSEVAALPIQGDPDKLEKILNNLISNALKFTPSGGVVRVQIGLDAPEARPDEVGKWACLSVNDTGKGISPTEQTHLFERFFQSESVRGGTGIGLSLTKSLVELHGGVISVDSEPDVQTRFRVFLPLSTESPFVNLPVERSTTPPALPIELVSLSEGQPNESGIAALRELPVLDEQRPKILLVEDNADVLDYLDLLFQDHYRVSRAENGRQALEYIQEHEPDVIISDVMMPDMDGLTLCRTLKADIATSHIPLILLTARSTVEQQIEGIGLGADDYMPKPFHPQLLRGKVKNILDARRRLIEKFRVGGTLTPKELARNPLDEAFLQKVMDMIMANLSNEEFSVEELGEHVHMSRSNLFRKLKAITGQTPIEFIYFVRLQHGRQLLLERKLNISEITYEIGFKNPSSFSKSFRRQFGKSPTEYINSLLATAKE